MLRILAVLIGSGISIYLAYKFQYWLRPLLGPYNAWILAAVTVFGSYILLLYTLANFNV